MSETETIAALLIALTIGGGLGARQSGVAIWRGSVVAAAAFIAASLVLYLASSESFLIGLLSLVVVAGIAGSVQGLKAQQTGIILIGALILGMITYAVLR